MNLTIPDGRNGLKMSFSEPAGSGVEERWGNFDKTSFGNGTTSTWNTSKLYTITSQASNTSFPTGTWVLTVYSEEQKAVLTAPGAPVPVPGDDDDDDDDDAFPTLYTVGAFNSWDVYNPTPHTANNEGVYSFTMSGDFKMSFSKATSSDFTAAWSEFDAAAFGVSQDDSWTPGLHVLSYNADNSRLPEGEWVVTVYYPQERIALSAPGAEVPVPGNDSYGVSGTLPILFINVYDENGKYDNEVISYSLDHKNYFNGEYWLDMNGCEWMGKNAKSVGSKDEPLPLQIKARGNYTRTGFSKKPFKLKLDKKQALLGLSKSKHFAILAHADDNYGFLRNFTGFELGKRIGLPWTPSQQPVEVVINGNYRGLYFLTESIRIDEDRVNIREGLDNETEKEYISGGYIVELDNYDEAEDAQITMAEKHCAPGTHYYDKLRITFDTPEVYSSLQRQFITDQFTAMNNAVGNCNKSDELWRYMDLDDAARYYLVNEIVSHTESYHGSTYLFRDHGNGQKWHFSPLWDMGNAFNGSTRDHFYNSDPFGNTWIPSIRENATFNAKVKATWLWFMSNNYDGITDAMDEYIDHIEAAAALDYARWTAGNIPQKSNNEKNIRSRLSAAKQHLATKTEWLKSKFGDYTGATYSEPERDTTEAAPLPDYAQTRVEEITVDNADNHKTWYNLQGQPVSNPVRGNIYVTSKGLVKY